MFYFDTYNCTWNNVKFNFALMQHTMTTIYDKDRNLENYIKV